MFIYILTPFFVVSFSTFFISSLVSLHTTRVSSYFVLYFLFLVRFFLLIHSFFCVLLLNCYSWRDKVYEKKYYDSQRNAHLHITPKIHTHTHHRNHFSVFFLSFSNLATAITRFIAPSLSHLMLESFHLTLSLYFSFTLLTVLTQLYWKHTLSHKHCLIVANESLIRHFWLKLKILESSISVSNHHAHPRGMCHRFHHSAWNVLSWSYSKIEFPLRF